ncbi:hypothetical protein [Plantactinospora sp. KBS50]|uniref:hypothetical protein n=1 Tax=Plantactinospora sp. KBS50 TaxID=2024580 RepID=UPI000BAB16C8|nr:hypothetical protein [Plantactinospora sp. KBS50]ASW55517.1 hypothetical protein CIK06_17060 [Plantactinospora sp. KBS50]
MKRPPLPIAVASGLILVEAIVFIVFGTPILAALGVLTSAIFIFYTLRGNRQIARLTIISLAIKLLMLIPYWNPLRLFPVVLWTAVTLLFWLPEQSREWFRQND